MTSPDPKDRSDKSPSSAEEVQNTNIELDHEFDSDEDDKDTLPPNADKPGGIVGSPD